MALTNWSQTQVLEQLDSGRKWSGSTITYSFPTSAGALYGQQGETTGFRAANAAQQQLFVVALATWDELIAPNMTPDTAGSTNIEFGYTSTGIGYAHAYYPERGSAWFNANEPTLVNPSLGNEGFLTFIHEIGHALGLNHMGNYNGNGNWTPSSKQDSVVLSVMSYFGPRYTAPYYHPEVASADWTWTNGATYFPLTPMVNDVMAIQTIYGASTTTRLDNTVYGFSSTVGGPMAAIYDFTQNPAPILTLFDSGGSDTLDLGGWNTPSRIDLNAGAYSSANSMTNNIAIAYGTTIENATSGGGDDVITGNDVANTLRGGGGNDTIVGGGGNDTVVFEGRSDSYTITIAGDTVTVSGAASGTDRVNGVEIFQFADLTRTLAELSPNSDSTAPQITSVSPTDNATGIATGSNLLLVFNESVKLGSGSFGIYNADGTLVSAIDATDASQARVSGNTVTLDPAADLPASRGYYVTAAAGSVTDLAGNAWAGLSGNASWNFTTGSTSDTAAPLIQSVSPADGATSITPGANLVLVFNEKVGAGSGNITLRDAQGNARTIAVGDTTQVLFEGNTVTVNPTADLAAAASYTVTIDAGAVRDSAGNAHAGIADTSAWNFTTLAAASTDDYPLDVNTSASVIVNGAPITARIDNPNDGDLFRADLVAGITYQFDMTSPTSSAVDPYLILYGVLPELELITYDDDGGPLPQDSRIFITPSTTGTYYLAAWDYAEATGSYSISASAPSDDFLGSTATSGRLISDGASVNGTIGVPGDVDYFALAVTAGKEYSVSLQSTGLDDPYLVLLDATGQAIDYDDDSLGNLNSQVTFTATVGGNVHLAVFDFDTGVGGYDMRAFTRNVFNGSSSADTVIGSPSTDTLYGLAGNDLLQGNGGDDNLHGGDGIDMARYGGTASTYYIAPVDGGYAIHDNSGAEGRDLLYGVERLQFANMNWALDLDGNAGIAAKTLGAVFGRQAVNVPVYVGIGLDLLDGGIDYPSLMQLALDAALGTAASHTTVVNMLYANVVGVAPGATDLAFFKGLLDDGTHTPASLGVLAAETELNARNINLVGLADYGIGYV